MFLFQTLNIFHTFFLRYTIFGFEQANVSWEEIFPIAKLSRFLALMKHHPYAKKTEWANEQYSKSVSELMKP